MIVVDTTVLVYAVGTEHPLKEPCRTLISTRMDALTTTAGVLQEFVQYAAAAGSEATPSRWPRPT